VPVMDNTLMTTADVARYLKVSTRTVRRLQERDELMGRRVGRQWRFVPAEVEILGLPGMAELVACSFAEGLAALDRRQPRY